MNELLRGARVQIRVIGALALRETRTRYGGHELGYVWALSEPLFWIGTIYAASLFLHRAIPEQLDIVGFLATGIVTYELVIKAQDRVSQAIGANKALLFYPQVLPLDLVFARVALEFATYAVVMTIILGVNALFRGELEIASMLTLTLGFVLAALLGGTAGLVFCVASVVVPTVDRMKGPFMRPLFWISGLFFTAHMLPPRVREIMLWNPVFHCIELVRTGWFHGYHGEYASPAYVMMWILGLAFAGLTLERWARYKIEMG